MFPLGSVLLPGAVLPLHVFEPRYRKLTQDCLAGAKEFGVVLIERGFEVGGGDVRAGVGTVARIVAAEEEEDGRWYLMAVGTRRIRVDAWLEDDPYPRAEVASFEDPSGAAMPDGAAYAALLAQARRVLALAAEVGVPAGDATSGFADDPRLGTFQVASLAPLGPLDRQRVLTTEGAAARTDLLGELLSDAEILLNAYLERGGEGDR
jgi:hypothetical protein